MAEVACVIPTHGRDALLDEAIASVARQELAPVELVVADDLGSGSTRAVVDRWAAAVPFRVRYVDASGGGHRTAGASRNAGAAEVTAPLLAFLDDDDVWEAGFIRRLVDALGTDADLAVAWTRPEAGPASYRMARMRPDLTARDVVARNPGFVGSNFLIRTAAFRALGGFDPALPVSNDKDLLVRALLQGFRYVVVPEYLLRNRIHDGDQLTDKTERRAAGLQLYAEKHRSLLSWRDELYLRGQVASVRRVSAPTRTQRLRSTLTLAAVRALDGTRRTP